MAGRHPGTVGLTPAPRVCEGRVALVTGASDGGTGTAIAVRLASAGAAVAVTARGVAGLEETRRRIEESGGRCIVLPADLAERSGGRRELVARAEAELGPVDILVNDAFVGGLQPFDETTADDLERFLQVNLVAPWELMKAVVPGMRERGRGWILNLTTLLADLPPGPPFPPLANGAFAYGASKAALSRLTVVAAGECEGQGIAVNALSPVLVIGTPKILSGAVATSPQVVYEPLETMAEAALALCTCDPATVTGRIAYSLLLLGELERPVYDLRGEQLLEGWQPHDLGAVVARQEQHLATLGWPDPYSLDRNRRPGARLSPERR